MAKCGRSPRPQATAYIDCLANRSGNTPRVPGQARDSGGVMMLLRHPVMPGSRVIPEVELIPWDRSRRTLLAFMTWWGMSGNGRRIVTTIATLGFPQTGARTKRRRVISTRRTHKESAFASIAELRGCSERGRCARLRVSGIPPITVMSSWGFASRRRCREMRAYL